VELRGYGKLFESMKQLNIIILSYYYPPINAVGSKRVFHLSRELKKLGHQLKVICGDPGYKHTEEGDSEFEVQRCLVRPQNGPFYELRKRLAPKGFLDLQYLHFEPSFDADLIFASVPPWNMLFNALELKERFFPKASLVYDYRDLWNDPSAEHTLKSLSQPDNLKGRFYSALDRFWEHYLLKKANGVVSVSKPLIQELKTLGPERLKYKVITNGFKALKENPKKGNSDVFTITFTGVLRSEQFFEEFNSGFLDFLDCEAVDQKLVRLKLVGPGDKGDPSLVERISSGIPSENMEVLTYQPQDKVEKIQSKSEVLLQFGFKGKKGIMSAKIFEYAASRKAILLVSREADVMEKFLKESGAGEIAENPLEVRDLLLKYYQNWKNGIQNTEPNKEFLGQYQYEHLASTLSDYFIALTK